MSLFSLGKELVKGEGDQGKCEVVLEDLHEDTKGPGRRGVALYGEMIYYTEVGDAGP